MAGDKFSVEHVQDSILEHIRASIPQKVVETSWRDAQLIEPINGRLPPYVSVEFGDLQPTKRQSAIGVWGDNHILPISFFAMAHSPSVTRKLSNMVFTSMLGYQTDFSSEVRKRAGGQLMPLKASNGAIEGYSVLIMFEVSIQLAFL